MSFCGANTSTSTAEERSCLCVAGADAPPIAAATGLTAMLSGFSRSSSLARAVLAGAAAGHRHGATACGSGIARAACHGAAVRALSTASQSCSSEQSQPQPPMRGLALAVTAALTGGTLWVSTCWGAPTAVTSTNNSCIRVLPHRPWGSHEGGSSLMAIVIM